ncbi:uncharacterized protein LOC34619545 [Cyclospora cayetanensis]|uniref:Uncharacterized protein LOC34619545 n=1 Tax=Cyclospora cayetanensis TaxID=88456 RepID=A0A6P6RTZ4_9EIME|nr:uncharacterized protein LOC34619545 [Cyclospora cayetanensis]
MARSDAQEIVQSPATVLPSHRSSFSSLDGYATAPAAATGNHGGGWCSRSDRTPCGQVTDPLASPMACRLLPVQGCPAVTVAAAVAAAPLNCTCAECCLATKGFQCDQKEQQYIAQLFSCCDTSTVDALLLALLARITSEHPQLLQEKFLRVLTGTEEKVVSRIRGFWAAFDTASVPAVAQGTVELFKFRVEQGAVATEAAITASGHCLDASGMSEVDFNAEARKPHLQLSESHSAGTMHHLLQQQEHLACIGNGSSMNDKDGCCMQRIVVIGLQCRSSNKDVRLLRWARRHLLRPNDIAVLVSCWEFARDPKYVRVPGMILSATSAAGAYNRQQQHQVQQRMRSLAGSALKGLHVYCLAVPISSTNKTSVGDLLCRVSRELHADAILLGARSHWHLTRMLFGSVAGYARAHANCPVLQCSNT